MNHIQKWDRRFLDLARTISTWSKDPSTQVGAVIVDLDRRIVSMGYNGFPQGVPDDVEDYENRERKYETIVHAEMNAVLFAKQPLFECHLYTYPFMPCSRCAAMIIQTGISTVIAPKNIPYRWEKNMQLTQTLFDQAGVRLLLV